MRLAVLFLASASLAGPVGAQTTDDRPLPAPVPWVRDSGALDNPALESRVVYSEPILVPGASWIRVYFGDVRLTGSSTVRVTSDLDGEVQELGAEALEQWGHASAYFNGDTVTVELVAGPSTTGNRLVVDRLSYEVPDHFEPSLCGADDRVPSDEDFAGRILPNGCSGAIWRENSCMISVGHCFDSPTDAQVIEFRVPLNAPNCAWQHPPIADQFPIVDDSWAANGVGNDWAVATAGRNNLGELPFERYGALRPIALEVPSTSSAVTIWGYGSDTECMLDNVQQRSDGQITALTSNGLFHNADTMGGNSGSAVIHDGTIVAAHSHAGCPQNGSTRIDHSAFALARANLCLPQAGELTLDDDAYSCSEAITIALEDRSLIGAGDQDVTVSSPTEPAGETVSLDERYAAVFAADVATTDSPPGGGDGVLSVSHGDTITVTYVDADDGAGGTGVPRVATATADCQGPVVSDVQVTSIGFFEATVSWTVDEPASGAVQAMGPTGSSSASEPSLQTSHSLTLVGLQSCAPHVFAITSVDRVGNVAVDSGGPEHAFQTLCSAPPAVPDGTGGTEPVRVSVVDSQVIVSWYNECELPGSTKILYGPLGSVASYALSGAICGIAPEADQAPLSGLLLGDLWFLVAKDNGLGQEGSWGEGAFGERNGDGASGLCGSSQKELGGTCPP